MKIQKTVLTIAIGGVLLSVPATIPSAVADDPKTTSNPSIYSDRDRTKELKDEKETLEQTLKTGGGEAVLSPRAGKNGLANHFGELRQARLSRV
jgi:hypothetical protein